MSASPVTWSTRSRNPGRPRPAAGRRAPISRMRAASSSVTTRGVWKFMVVLLSGPRKARRPGIDAVEKDPRRKARGTLAIDWECPVAFEGEPAGGRGLRARLPGRGDEGRRAARTGVGLRCHEEGGRRLHGCHYTPLPRRDPEKGSGYFAH